MATPGVRRYGLDRDDAPANVRAVVEAQRWRWRCTRDGWAVAVDTIHATGGAAANRADPAGDGRRVRRRGLSLEVDELGRARRGACAPGMPIALDDGRTADWDALVAGLEQPAQAHITPDPERHQLYRELVPIYERCERHALGSGGEPSRELEAFAAKWERRVTGVTGSQTEQRGNGDERDEPRLRSRERAADGPCNGPSPIGRRGSETNHRNTHPMACF